LQLQNNSTLGVAVNSEECSSTLCFEIKKKQFVVWLRGIDKFLMTTVKSNLRTSWSWNTVCIMDWAFTKPSTVRPRFLLYHAYPS